MEEETIGIIGSGAWGTALAIAIASSGKKVTQWCREKNLVESMLLEKENKIFLPNIKIPESVSATNELNDLKECNNIFLVTPAQFTRNICMEIKKQNIISQNSVIISCSKGIENETLLLQTEILQEIFPNNFIAALSGPTLAIEVAKLLPTSATYAFINQQNTENICNIFKNTNLDIAFTNDIIGTQIGGVVKNIIAIGCGIADGLELGENFHATLINYGLKEAALLARAKGAKFETFLEPSGIGDMVLTCSSKNSRNYSFGYHIGSGNNIKNIIQESTNLVEGYKSAKPLLLLSKKLGINMPICEVIYKIIYEFENPKIISNFIKI